VNLGLAIAIFFAGWTTAILMLMFAGWVISKKK
jgi:hypothetical protein